MFRATCRAAVAVEPHELSAKLSISLGVVKGGEIAVFGLFLGRGRHFPPGSAVDRRVLLSV
jgi:hypothetical protein